MEPVNPLKTKESPTVIALFGESQKGNLDTGYFCERVDQLLDYLGEPPPESRGLHYAIQALLYEKTLLYFRVREEGFSVEDYLYGMHLLKVEKEGIPHVAALCLPGVGNKDIIEEGFSICHQHGGILIVGESDLYDYLTFSSTL